MATVEPRIPEAGAAAGITVETPATGQPIRTVPVTPPQDIASMVHHARDVQPAWEAAGFEGRARVLRRAQKGVITKTERIADTIVSETGKTWEDAFASE